MSTAVLVAQVLIAVTFICLIGMQEICRVLGSSRSLDIAVKLEHLVYRFGAVFSAMILWKFAELAI